MRIFLVCFSLLFSKIIFSQNPSVTWAKQIGGLGFDVSWAHTIDASGNVYVTGSFQGNIDADPGPGVYNLTGTSATGINGLVAKFDALGNFIWAKHFTGNGEIDIYSIELDASGNILFAGFYGGTIDFDPGGGVYNLTSNGFIESYIAKLDGNGNLIWAKSIGGVESDYGQNLKIDQAGNIYLGGTFKHTVDFDPGAAVHNITSKGWGDYFLLKLNSSGDFIWVRTWGSDGDDGGLGVSIDGSGNVYVLGHFFNLELDLDPGLATHVVQNTGDDFLFIIKLNGEGNFLWARTYNNAVTSETNIAIVDEADDIYVTGVFTRTTNFDAGASNYTLTTLSNADDIFVLKLDKNGNFKWVKDISGNGELFSFSIDRDKNGNLYITGSFESTVDFDPGVGIANFTATDYDVFILKLNVNGDYLWSKTFEGGESFGVSLRVDARNNVYVSGLFKDYINFDPGNALLNFTSAGESDMFFVKLFQPVALPAKLFYFNATKVEGSVKLSWQAIADAGTNGFIVERSSNGTRFDAIGEVKAVSNTHSKKDYLFIDQQPLHGKSFYRLKIINYDGSFVYSKTVEVTFKQQDKLILYGNEVSNMLPFQVRSPNKDVIIEIIDVQGKLLKRENNFKSNEWHYINVSMLPAGKYFIIYYTDGVKEVRQFIKR